MRSCCCWPDDTVGDTNLVPSFLPAVKPVLVMDIPNKKAQEAINKIIIAQIISCLAWASQPFSVSVVSPPMPSIATFRLDSKTVWGFQTGKRCWRWRILRRSFELLNCNLWCGRTLKVICSTPGMWQFGSLQMSELSTAQVECHNKEKGRRTYNTIVISCQKFQVRFLFLTISD
jgi:hypothetical protein